jgi:hypothetical protein
MSQRIAYDWESAAEQVGYSVRTLKKAVSDGNLAARYANTKAIIRHEDLVEWVDGLSAESPSTK